MRRTRGPDNGSVAVELVEVPPDDDPADPLAGPARSGSGTGGTHDGALPDARSGRRRALWWVGAGVIVALVVAVVSVNVVEARREAARREALAELPWVLPPLSGPLEEVWRAPGGYVLAEATGLLVMADLDAMGQSLVAVDRESGTVVWERASLDDSCRALIDSRRWSDLTAADPQPEVELLACLPHAVDPSAGSIESADGSVVELVDVATGRVVTSIQIEGVVIGSDIVEEDVVVASILADGSLAVVRAAGRTGEPVWTYRGEPASVPPDGRAWAYVNGDVVLVDGAVRLAVSLETGREVPVPDGALDGVALTDEVSTPLPDGAEVRVRYDPTTGRAESGRVVDADGSTRFTFEGGPWWQGWTDGSAAGVFVVRQEDTSDEPGNQGLLLGLDLATGDQLWSVPDALTQRLLQLDGLAVATGVRTSVLDVRTGHQLWERPSDEIAWVPLTDGDTVLLPERGTGGDGLVAVDLRTGVESWWMPAQDDLIDVRVADSGLILLLTTSEIVAYR